MLQSMFRVPAIGLGFFFMAGVLDPVAGQSTVTPPETASPSAPSPIKVSHTHSAAEPCAASMPRMTKAKG